MPGVRHADRRAHQVDITLASHILDAIRAHMKLHVGFCQWTRDDGVSLWVCSARNNGQRWVAKYEDFYGAAVALAGLVGFELEDG